MNERIKQLAEQAGYFLYDLTKTHERKTVETDSKDEWITLERFAELVRQDERERIAQHFDSRIYPNLEDNGWYEPDEPAEIIRGMT